MERPGNRYGEVFEFVYVTPGSFDGFSWQTLETKLAFIKDLERGIVQHDADDIGDEVASYAAIKAIASGNPLMLKKVELDSALIRLDDALRAEWLRARSGHVRDKAFIESRIPQVEAEIRTLEESIVQREATGQDFPATIDGQSHTEREAAGKALRHAVQVHREFTRVGSYRGLNLVGQSRQAMGQLGFEQELVIGLALLNGNILQANSEVTDKGLFSSLDAVLRSLDKKLEQARELLACLQSDLASLESEIKKAWQHDDAFEKAATELAALNAELDRWSRQQAEKKESEGQDIDMTVTDNDDGWLDIFQAALSRIDEMHQRPIEVELPKPVIKVIGWNCGSLAAHFW